MRYYRTAVLLSWQIVGTFLLIATVDKGIYNLIPFYLICMVVGGTIPALICARVLKGLQNWNRYDSKFLQAIRGVFLALAYAMGSRLVIKLVIGHVAIDSIKGFLCYMVFGPAVLIEMGWYGLFIIATVGAVNSLLLSDFDRPDKSP